ncbi:MAG: hypothetical protein H6Q05_4687 [Acidobacteria bacterium]|nr:hypothetical protein [Acidobacteriota bacterium]
MYRHTVVPPEEAEEPLMLQEALASWMNRRFRSGSDTFSGGRTFRVAKRSRRVSRAL